MQFSDTSTTRRAMGRLGLIYGIRAGGEEFPIEASISQIEVTGKKLLTVIMRDVSERNRMEAQLRQAQKMESIGTLASGIAHDFNNVLNNVLGFAGQLKKHIQDQAKVQKYVDTNERSAHRGAELSSQLLSFARTSGHHTVPTDLGQIVREVLTSCRETFPASMTIEDRLEPALAPVLGDRGELYQVVLNLCVNARDAMQTKGGTGVLRVSARNVVVGHDVSPPLFAAPGDQCVELVVADTGCGIPEEIRSKIFDPFFTTKERGQGTGLGLAIVYNIVHSHHGTISLESEPGEGTCFHLYFPAIQRQAPPDPPAPGPARRILLVDDEPAMQELGKELLEDEGYQVLVATNGREAIDIYRTRSGEIDLVVLDLVMPGMDGGQVYVEMKKINPSIKAFFCTGYISDHIIAGLLEAENLRAISKPFRPDQFLETVREVMGA